VSKEARDHLRAKLLKSSTFKKHAVALGGGDQVYLREPSVAESRAINDKCAKDSAGDVDRFEFIVRSVIAVAHDEDGQPILEEADFDALMGQSLVDSPIQTLINAYGEMMSGGAELGKGSGETQS
jgi:hypothetical protein